MKPTVFEESNTVLNGGGEVEGSNLLNLHTYTDGKQSVSCWKMSWKERLIMLFTGKLWVGSFTGEEHPPLWIDASKPKFDIKNK